MNESAKRDAKLLHAIAVGTAGIALVLLGSNNARWTEPEMPVTQALGVVLLIAGAVFWFASLFKAIQSKRYWMMLVFFVEVVFILIFGGMKTTIVKRAKAVRAIPSPTSMP